MSFELSKVFWALAAPGNALLIALVLGLFFLAIGWRRSGWVVSGLAVAGFLAIAVLPLGYWLLRPLESRFPRPAEPPARVDGIIVLGGAVSPLLTAEWGIASLNAHAERMTAAVELTRLHPEARLVFTGGSGSVQFQQVKEAPVARELWASMGLDTDRILFEDQSRNTWENAVFTRELVAPRPEEVWLLVTSANHMPRSMGVFRQAGWNPVAWPVAYKSSRITGTRLDFDMADRLTDVTLATREWLGLAAYHLMGRTPSLFPAPADGRDIGRNPAGAVEAPGAGVAQPDGQGT